MHYAFADCILETQRYVLHRAECTISLRPKVFQMLLYLLEHRDRVVSKQELVEQLWPDQFISDGVVANIILAVRQAVGDTGQAQQIIQTLYGHGYRFVAPLLEATAPWQQDEATTEPTNTAQADVPSQATDMISAHDTSAVSRRQLTVLCCDVIDSTSLASRLDPEILFEAIQSFYAACTKAMQHFEGYIAQTLDAGLVVYFGYPQAHEDDAERAVHAGLSVLSALATLSTRLVQENDVRLNVRLGIHTGVVVVGTVNGFGRQEPLALGMSPHIAAQLGRIAAPNQAVISEHTRRLIGGVFDVEALGVHTLQGITDPTRVYGVRGESAVESRFEAATVTA